MVAFSDARRFVVGGECNVDLMSEAFYEHLFFYIGYPITPRK